MRKIVRKVFITTVDVLRSENGNVDKAGELVIEGAYDIKKVKKEMNKKFPNDNVFIGSYETKNKVYSMDVKTFMEHAVEEKED